MRWRLFFAAFGLLLLVQLGVALAVIDWTAPFGDTDDYMRLNRVRHLLDQGDWFDRNYPRINPPTGHTQHWTRPMDALLLLGVWAGTPPAGSDRALVLAGLFASPLLQVVALLGMTWLCSLVLRPGAGLLALVVFLAHPSVLGTFMLGRPDHHALIMATLTWLLAMLVRMLPAETGTSVAGDLSTAACGGLSSGSAALWAGALSAWALWVSVEVLPMLALGYLVFIVLWLRGNASAAGLLFRMAMATSGGLAAAVLIERGTAGTFAFEYDTLSVAHVCLFLICALVWGSIHWASLSSLPWFSANKNVDLPRWSARKLWTLSLVAAAAAVLLFAVAPGFLRDPLSNVDLLYRHFRLARIAELQQASTVGAEGAFAGFKNSVYWLGVPLVALLWTVHCFRADRGSRAVSGLFLAGLALYSFLAFRQVRWAPYAVLFAVVPHAALAHRLLARLSEGLVGWRQRLGRPLVMAGLCTWFLLPSLGAGGSVLAAAPAKQLDGDCDVGALTHYLRDPSHLGKPRGTLMAFTDVGPRLLFETDYSVLSIPNHRFQPGFGQTLRTLRESDPQRAATAFSEAAAGWLVVCPSGTEAAWFASDPGEPPSLHQRLAKGEVPDFLALVSDGETSGGYRIYRRR